MAGIESAGVLGQQEPSSTGRWRSFGRDLLAGVTVASLSLPICLATGLLLFGPLGAAFAAAGIVASLYGFIVGGGIAALAAKSSFVVSSPRASTALVQAGLIAALPASAPMLQQPSALVAAMALCVLLAGAWQLLFGTLGLARIIKFTPHPVLAGFINGIALLIVASQLKPFFGRSFSPQQPALLVFVVGLAAFVLAFGRLTRKIPAGLAGLTLGVVLFYAAKPLFPAIDLGPVIGAFSLPLPPHMPLGDLLRDELAALTRVAWAPILLTSLALAVVATLESLLSLRAAQTLSPVSVSPARDLIAQGMGNCASAVCGGMAITSSPLQSATAFRAGGRSRWVALAAIGVIAALVLAAPQAVAALPIGVLSALLVATGVLLFDRWSAALLGEAFRAGSAPRRRRAWADLAVVGCVMLLTAAVSIPAGIVAGCLLSCFIFIVNMSGPIIRQRHTGETLSSKRVRAAADAAFLRQTGSRRRVLQLQGVLFFGNADDLSREIRELFTRCDALALDMRGISDIDASGANILRGVVESSGKAGKQLLFCHVPEVHSELVSALASAGSPSVLPDLDSALEWMEEKALRGRQPRAPAGALPLWTHPVLAGLAEADREALVPYLVRRTFPAGSLLCAEGERADTMWLLTMGSVSIRLQASNAGDSRRLSACAVGTVIGEMALLHSGVRSASVVADEDVEVYELTRASFDRICAERPRTGVTILKNMAGELAQRLRARTEDLRFVLS